MFVTFGVYARFEHNPCVSRSINTVNQFMFQRSNAHLVFSLTGKSGSYSFSLWLTLGWCNMLRKGLAQFQVLLLQRKFYSRYVCVLVIWYLELSHTVCNFIFKGLGFRMLIKTPPCRSFFTFYSKILEHILCPYNQRIIT